jgi:DNA-directed RNA polymerase specialized sigma24 family protein
MIEDNCIDQKIENALNDKDIINIMNYASRQFTNQLDADEIYTCKLNALWKCFVNFKPEKQCKFTTYLFKGVYIECLKAAKFLNKNKRFRKLVDTAQSGSLSDQLLIDILDEANNEHERDLLLDKISRMTNEELSDKYDIGKETIRKKVKKMTKNFHHKFL